MSRPRGTFGNTVTNWKTYEAPFRTKLRLLFRNNWRKVSTRSNCCGNDGEPGC